MNFNTKLVMYEMLKKEKVIVVLLMDNKAYLKRYKLAKKKVNYFYGIEQNGKRKLLFETLGLVRVYMRRFDETFRRYESPSIEVHG